ncbi:hypothetical protein BH24ACT15_BH24ACT15_31190 [soil metagenome]
MTLSRWAVRIVAASTLAIISGCGSETETPPAPDSPPNAQAKPAEDCSESNVELPALSEIEGVTLSATTDATRTSLLLKNTGELSAVIIPDENGTTQLHPAPYANPTDAASVAALDAVANSADPNAVPGIPAGIPVNQVFFVPPQWAVCGVTGALGQPAAAQYLRDKRSSAQYFVTRSLAEDLVTRITPKALNQSRSLISCAEGTLQLLQADPGLQGLDLYSKVVGTGSACHSTYSALLSNDEAASRRTESKALSLLKKSPTLLDNTRFFVALVR